MITRKVKNQYGEELTNADVERILAEDEIDAFIHGIYYTGYQYGDHEAEAPDSFFERWKEEFKELVKKL